MQDDRISIELGLPEVVVLGVKEEERWIEVVGQYRTEEADCPRCGRATWQACLPQAGSPVAPAAKAGRQALEEARLAGTLEAALSLPELPQGVHRTRSGLRGEKADNGEAAGHRGGLGE
ncbi:MAG: hypothetical protein ACE5FA_07655 [Dehalococcoidia bacterium]